MASRTTDARSDFEYRIAPVVNKKRLRYHQVLEPFYYYVNQLHSLSDSNSDCDGGANHRVVTHAHEAHHLDVCRN